ncbi:MAG: class I SAM-dependent methyltransferase [Pirellulales bacterium]|nr:class I SAM-dependent methyltransferase [Pirellulales bacterium]
MRSNQGGGGLPDYAERLDALHRALVDDFREIVGQLPLAGGETVLDAGCGDGFFTGLLAERLPRGRVIALDSSPAYLKAARGRLSNEIAAGRVTIVEGDVNRLPADAGSLDGVWSAHSMQSYPHIPRVLEEFRRVLKRGGLLAVLETDNLHSLMLSWPPDIELALRQAEHREIGDEDSYLGTYFPRFAHRLLSGAGFAGVSRRYALVSRLGPAREALERYVELYLQNLLQQHSERIDPARRGRLAEIASRESPRFLPRQEDFFFGSLQTLIVSRR